jgi:hypothetical protein
MNEKVKNVLYLRDSASLWQFILISHLNELGFKRASFLIRGRQRFVTAFLPIFFCLHDLFCTFTSGRFKNITFSFTQNNIMSSV